MHKCIFTHSRAFLTWVFFFFTATDAFNSVAGGTNPSNNGTGSPTDVTDLTLQHAVMEKMGWKMLGM